MIRLFNVYRNVNISLNNSLPEIQSRHEIHFLLLVTNLSEKEKKIIQTEISHTTKKQKFTNKIYVLAIAIFH